jgi:predicted alpha/beta-fold hydrolase
MRVGIELMTIVAGMIVPAPVAPRGAFPAHHCPLIVSHIPAASPTQKKKAATLERYLARDGASLSYRTYAAGERLIVLLTHGSAGSSSSMHTMAKALQEAGITIYVPDLRGHGDNQPRGDVAYITTLAGLLGSLHVRD